MFTAPNIGEKLGEFAEIVEDFNQIYEMGLIDVGVHNNDMATATYINPVDEKIFDMLSSAVSARFSGAGS